MTKYSLKNGQQGDKILHINGNQSICPWVQALPMQGQYGQIQIMRLPCTTSCPHAKLEEKSFQMTCGGSNVTFEIEEIEEENVIPIIGL